MSLNRNASQKASNTKFGPFMEPNGFGPFMEPNGFGPFMEPNG